MPSERSSDVKFEIGHVLFIDIVGYSKLLISEQSELQQTLKEIVRGSEQFRLAQARVVVISLSQYGLAEIGLKSESGFGRLPCLFTESDRWLKSLCDVAARFHVWHWTNGK